MESAALLEESVDSSRPGWWSGQWSVHALRHSPLHLHDGCVLRWCRQHVFTSLPCDGCKHPDWFLMMISEFAVSPPKKDCLTGASWPVVFAQLSVHVTFIEKLLTYGISELPLVESQTVSPLCSFSKVSFHSWSGGAELVLANREAVLPEQQPAILGQQLPSCHAHKTELTLRSAHPFCSGVRPKRRCGLSSA